MHGILVGILPRRLIVKKRQQQVLAVIDVGVDEHRPGGHDDVYGVEVLSAGSAMGMTACEGTYAVAGDL